MSVLTQLVQSREMWCNTHREIAERARQRRAVLEFALVVVLGIATFLFHARIIELVSTFSKRF